MEEKLVKDGQTSIKIKFYSNNIQQVRIRIKVQQTHAT